MKNLLIVFAILSLKFGFIVCNTKENKKTDSVLSSNLIKDSISDKKIYNVDLIYKMFNEYDEEDTNAIVPYQSTTINIYQYEGFVKHKINDYEIYFASKKINESFSENDSITIKYITKFLERASIKVVITHSIDEDIETFYLKGNEKLDFFYSPEVYNGKKTRRKSDYYNVKGNCYEFNNEGISHNSIYIKKLCYLPDEKGISLSEMYLLDGD